MLVSVMALLYGGTVGEPGAGESFGNVHLYGLVVLELVTLPVVAVILHTRGWRVKDFPVLISKPATALGVLAYAAGLGMNFVLGSVFWSVFASLRPMAEAFAAYQPPHPPSLVAVYLVSVINPVFEEVIVCGYVVPALTSRFGQTTAINVSVIIRGTYHLYQGVVNLPFHLGYGLMQAYLYARFRNLWPLIVSHALGDFVPLTFLL
jgi:membrane protease YdiL (CAAX protease family)